MLLFCRGCAVWWDSTSARLRPVFRGEVRCPKCLAVLESKPLERPTHQPRTELRPGVVAEWEA